MNYIQIKNKVKAIVADLTEYPEKDLKLESELVNGIGMDSLDILELETALEKEFDMKLDIRHHNKDVMKGKKTPLRIEDIVDHIFRKQDKN